MKRNIVIATVAAATLVAGGTAGAVAIADDNPAAPRQQPSVQISDDQDDQSDARDDAGDDMRDDTGDGARGDVREAQAARTDVAAAVDAALKDTPGTVTSVDLDDDDNGGGPAWDVDVLGKDGTWHDVTVDAGSAKVLGSHIDRDEDDTREARDALKGAHTDVKEAAAAALKTAPGAVTSVDLDDDGPAGGWEVEVQGKDGKQHDVNVDLKTGKVTTDQDDDHDDDHDGKDDDDSDD
jgi:uncharacterized membrane protein YkoI